MNEITFQDVFRELRILPITAPDFFSHLVSGLISNCCSTVIVALALLQCFGYQIINSIINTTTEVHYCQLDVATVKFSTLTNFSTMYAGQMSRIAYQVFLLLIGPGAWHEKVLMLQCFGKAN